MEKESFVQLGDTELIEQAQHDNFAAFEQLVYRYDKQVFTIAARFVQTADDAKDIYQEVFMRVYKGIKKFQQHSEFSTWLYRIATNVCISFVAQRKRHQHVSIDGTQNEEEGGPLFIIDRSHGAQTDSVVQSNDVSEKIHRALEILSPQQRMAFVLKHMQEYSIKEIATIMELGEGTVKKYLFEATRRMRHELKELV